MKNNKLLFVINELSFFFSHRLLLAKAASEAGYEVHVVAPMSDRIAELEQYGFHYHSIPLDRKGIHPWRELKSIYALYRLYKDLRPALVHHLTIKPVIYGGLAARLAKVPAVVNAVTGLGYVFISEDRKAKILRAFSKFAFLLSFRHPNMRVIFQNPDDQQQFIKNRLLKPERAELIKGSGVPLDEFQPLPEPDDSKIVVLLPARLLWDKGVAEFVQAAEILKSQLSVRMVLAGSYDEGNPAAIKPAQVDAWVRQSLVEFWGFQNPIQEAFARCHIICLPSYREGTPRVLIEAAACGRSIIATDVPGCRDIVSQGVNGLLVESKNPDALADAILKLAADPALRHRMARQGREIVEIGFSSQLVNEKTLAVYSSLLI